jgi:hypothetical protein
MASDALAQCLEEKKAQLVRLLAETRAQADILANRDVEGLQKSIAQRQETINSFIAADARMKKAHGDPKSEQAALLRSGIDSLVKEIRALDEENLKSAEALKAELAAGVRSTRAQKNLLAYAGKPTRTNRYLNKKG